MGSHRMGHDYFVYILTDKSRPTLYIGVTNDMATRLWQHRNPERNSFSQHTTASYWSTSSTMAM